MIGLGFMAAMAIELYPACSARSGGDPAVVRQLAGARHRPRSVSTSSFGWGCAGPAAVVDPQRRRFGGDRGIHGARRRGLGRAPGRHRSRELRPGSRSRRSSKAASPRGRSRSRRASTSSASTCGSRTTARRWSCPTGGRHEEIIATDEGARRLAGFMLRRYADRVQATQQGGTVDDPVPLRPAEPPHRPALTLRPTPAPAAPGARCYRRARRRTTQPIVASPASSSAYVPGSGTGLIVTR